VRRCLAPSAICRKPHRNGGFAVVRNVKPNPAAPANDSGVKRFIAPSPPMPHSPDCQQEAGVSQTHRPWGGDRMEETMKKLTFVLLAVLGLMSALPSVAGAFDGHHQFAPSDASGSN